MVEFTKTVLRFSKEQAKPIIEQRQLKSMEDVQGVFRDLFSQTLSAMLEGEMDDHWESAPNVVLVKEAVYRMARYYYV